MLNLFIICNILAYSFTTHGNTIEQQPN